MQNVETLAQLALVARFGPDWYRSMGTPDEPGSTLVTVAGAVARPGVCEIAIGTRICDAVAAAGGPVAEPSAVLVGGYFGSWLTASEAWETPLSDASLQPLGAAFGSGVIYVFRADHCGLVASARIVRYLAEETAGQCGPCVHGLDAIAGGLASVAVGRHSCSTLADLRRWFEQVRGRGACHYPDGVVRFAASVLDVFADEIARHERNGCCLSGDPPLFPTRPVRGAEASWR